MDLPNNTLPLDRDYLVGEVLGRGGMGVVYSAIQLSLGRRVAIKVPHANLASDPHVNRRFRTEALACGKLDHRNIARVIDFGGRDGALYLVMEYVAGVPLDRFVLEHGAMASATAVDVCTQILGALGEAHGAGIVHADIKSANVLVETQPNGTLRAVVIDFGLARFSNDTSPHDARVLSGTPDYLAPELVQGGVPTVASDIYSTGIVLYELLTGQTPFSGGTSAEILTRQIDDAVIPPSLRCPDRELSDALEDVVMRALAKDPSARFATAALFVEALCAATTTLIEPNVRIARGTLSEAFSTETTTRSWQRELMPVIRIAAVAGESTRIQQVRVVVQHALASGDGDAIVTSYLELVRALIDGRELVAAAGELERGLALLRPGVFSETPAAIWRLQLCLAALYSGMGDHLRAKCAAIVGQDDAVRASSTLGEDRAHALLVRLARSTPLAA